MKGFVGSIVAIVTPMHEDGSIDYESFGSLIDWHIESGTDAICVAGTTGEASTLSFEEHRAVSEFAVSRVALRCPVMVGAGSNSTREAIELTSMAKDVGADATLQVTPYYVRPSQEGLYRHFATVAESVDLPMMLYNVPSRTGTDLDVGTTMRLAQVPGIIGLKDATANLERGGMLLRLRPEGFKVVSGDDATSVPLMLLGGDGTISVSANVVPAAAARVSALARSGNAKDAATLHLKLLPLHSALFVENSPAPTKWALARLGRSSPACRLPITELSDGSHAILLDAMEQAGVFSETNSKSGSLQ
ncbi:4-hydroxy-tetrahydrodipicolinate synthase [Paraburkholderia sp. BL25I1N1]|uniref:4-hydroxy-tetrahydrodipicolinate synthase n=1 Tax=Paraburkholderia sp. BL25I1N1 TaxID=1938804 RepID=UPI000D05BD7B|nr:4-hydroxy-tetrahydrodipicolinate synthase [Paraburkholderia sp. BL25I1N1]PRY05955.1 4-hydroxy-tetrahydrodipicolinate synthase [Paraburkholderia sp. BL25I1N1]